MGSIKNGVRSMVVVRHEDDGRTHTTFQVDKLPVRPFGPALPSLFARREVTHR